MDRKRLRELLRLDRADVEALAMLKLWREAGVPRTSSAPALKEAGELVLRLFIARDGGYLGEIPINARLLREARMYRAHGRAAC